MRRTTTLLGVAAASVLTVLTACGGSVGEPSASAPSDVVAVPVSGPAEATASGTTDEATDDEAPTDEAAEDEATTDVAPATSTAGGAGSSTGGEQPTLSWEAVDGAVLYSVVVHTADGQPFWGWLGEATSVTVGDGAPDPLVSADMTWTVVALDADDTPIWESDALPV